MAKNKNSKRGNLKNKGQSQKKRKPGNIVKNTKRTGFDANPLPVDNPFELRVNKRKHENLGRRGRNEQGVPGISRSRAVEKRKATLLQEYKVRNKTNMLQDNRIGEKRKGMPEEEKIIRRSAAEKKRQFKQKSIFNLQETDDFFTHKGQPLIDVDRYEDPRDASDSEEERLDADFVSDANFGGFMKIKKVEEPEDDTQLDEEGRPKSHKQIIQELIIESKKRKFEKAKAADENYELVCKLDDDFKNPDIRNLLFMGGKDKKPANTREPPPPIPVTEKEEYDTLVRELQFETKTGRATDRLKTEDEVAKEEKEKLEQLEKERLSRMQMTDMDDTHKHRSADDLDDGFHVEEEFQESKGADDEGVASGSEDSEEDEDEDSDASDSYSDVESDEEKSPPEAVQKIKVKEQQNSSNCDKLAVIPSADEFLDIPFVIAIPTKFKDFEAMLKKFKAHYKFKGPSTIEILNVIFTRIVKYAKASDRTRLPQLFNYIMRYVLDMAEKTSKMSKSLSETCRSVLPHLHTLLLLNPTGCMDAVENGEIFDDLYPLKGLPIHKLVYFNICTQLFSVTDFNHKVLSSIKSKLLEALSQTKVTDITLLAKLLYIIQILYKLSKEAKRYSPEVVNTLNSILQCFTGDDKRWTGFPIPSMRPAKSFLYICPEPSSDVDEELWKLICDESPKSTPNTSQKLGVLCVTLTYIKLFAAVYGKLPSSIEIFQPIKKTLEDCSCITTWPAKISSTISETLETINSIKQKKEVLTIQVNDKPKPLRLYEPLIEEDFDGVRKKKAPKGKQETARLSYKVKQEMKNAVREIRKDTAFLAKQQLKEQLEKDADRKRKVKEIMGSLANQEGEYQKSKRAKK